MNFLLNLALFWIATFVSVIWFSLLILPIFYGLPRSLVWIARGKLKATACLFYLCSFLLWLILFCLAGGLMARYFPETLEYLYNNGWFFAGQWFGIIGSILKTITRRGRDDLNSDFLTKMKRFEKPVYSSPS